MPKINEIETKNILIVGVGGQGTLLASKIFGQAGLLAGCDVKQSEVHGMAQRGGSVVTFVRFGQRVYSPLIEKGQADVVLAFEKLEGLRWAEYLKAEGTLIVNDQEISPMPVIVGAAKYPLGIFERLNQAQIKTIKVDALKMAKDLGEIRSINIILLAVAAKLLGFEKNIWENAVLETVPPKSRTINLEAFSLGWEI